MGHSQLLMLPHSSLTESSCTHIKSQSLITSKCPSGPPTTVYPLCHYLNFLSVQLSCSVVSDSLQPHGLLHTRPPYPSPTPRIYSNSCPLSRWCHPTISSSVVPFSSLLQPFPASRSFQMSQLFTSGGQSIGVSASTLVLPMNTQDWSPLGCTGWISLQSKGLSRVFSNTTVQKHQFFASDGQSIGVSVLASVLPMNIPDWFPLRWTGGVRPSQKLRLPT